MNNNDRVQKGDPSKQGLKLGILGAIVTLLGMSKKVIHQNKD